MHDKKLQETERPVQREKPQGENVPADGEDQDHRRSLIPALLSRPLLLGRRYNVSWWMRHCVQHS